MSPGQVVAKRRRSCQPSDQGEIVMMCFQFTQSYILQKHFIHYKLIRNASSCPVRSSMKYMYHCTNRASRTAIPRTEKIGIQISTVKRLINWQKKPKIDGYLSQGLIWSFQSSNLCIIKVAGEAFPKVIAQKMRKVLNILIFLLSVLSYFSTTASGTLSIAGLEIVDSLFSQMIVHLLTTALADVKTQCKYLRNFCARSDLCKYLSR